MITLGVKKNKKINFFQIASRFWTFRTVAANLRQPIKIFRTAPANYGSQSEYSEQVLKNTVSF